MSAEPMLTEKLWCLLDSLADGQQPFEQVYAEYAARSPSATPDDLQADLAYLQAMDLVSVRGSSAPLAEAPGVSGLAVSPGTTVETTSRGRAEWEDARYEPYWKEFTPQPTESLTIPRRLHYVLAGMCLLLTAVAIWGYLHATWSMANDEAVDLGSCLRPIRATLAAAGAPPDVLAQLNMAAQPGIWRSDAVARLQAADASLRSMPAAPAVAEARADVERLMDACRPASPCQCGSLER